LTIDGYRTVGGGCVTVSVRSENGPETTAEECHQGGGVPRGPNHRRLVLILLLVTGVWIALFVSRVHAHQANVDDFLYARVSRDLLRAPNPISAALSTGQTSPLVPVLAGPTVDVWGLYGGIAINLPLLLILCVGSHSLCRIWLDDRTSVVVMLIVGLNGAVLAYSLMFNFALASAAALIWCLTCYLKSDGLHDWAWSLGLGASYAALVLSRSIAPVYAVPLALVIAGDLGMKWIRQRRRPGWPAFGALMVASLLAGPWWIRSGPQLFRYLLNAGYQPSSGYTNQGVSLSPHSIYVRLTHELVNLGWPQAIALGVALICSLILYGTRQNRSGTRGVWILWAWSAMTLLVLASSSNLGTAFGLPVIVVLIVGCGVYLGFYLGTYRKLVTVVVLGLLVVTGASQFSTSTNGWWPSPPYRTQALEAGATSETNIESLMTNVGVLIGEQKTVVGIQDPILNSNGIYWLGPNTWLFTPNGANATASAIRALSGSKWMVTGVANYRFDSIDDKALETAAVNQGFHPVRIWRVSDRANVLLWHKGGPSSALPGVTPAVRILVPKNGSTVTGKVDLVALVRSEFTLRTVRFEVIGGGTTRDLTPIGTIYGYVAVWNAQTVGSGHYTIRCTVSDQIGEVGSASIGVEVAAVRSR